MPEAALISTKDKASYCLGVETGRGLKRQFEDLDLELFWQGIAHSFKGEPIRITEDELRQVIVAIQQQMMQQQRLLLTKLSEENRKASEKFLEENKKKMGVTTLASGLQYKVLASKHLGASPTLLDTATIHYKASFPNGSVFESTIESNQPKKLAISQMIPGWAEAIKLMKVGEKWEVFIPPYLAYGEGGVPPTIPPNTMLIFEIELLGINEQ